MALVLLMGSPGAGKTTLARLLLDSFPSAALFSLDDVVGRHLENFDAHLSRKQFEMAVREYLEELPAKEWHLTILDDIFYLKSMRRPFERMARAYGFHLLIFHVKCDLDTILERNSRRGEERLPEGTIRRVDCQMELSDNCHSFENLPVLIEMVTATERRSPRPAEDEPLRMDTTIAEKNEMCLRRCVKLLVEEGLDGKRLGKAKKAVWSRVRSVEAVLAEDEVKKLLMDEVTVIDVSKAQLNLAAVLLNGQSFRWIETGGKYYGTACNRLWKIVRVDERQVQYDVLASHASSSPEDEETALRRYFNLPVDLEQLYLDWSSSDPHIKKLLNEMDELKGIRILGQEPLETLFAFICSANNNIKRISKMVNRMCTLYGSKLQLSENVSPEDRAVTGENGHLLYAFPSVTQLQEQVDGMEKQLRVDGFGYRAGYIAESVKLLAQSKISLEDLRFPNESVKESLLQFTGVGPKVADCVSLMGLGHHHVVPIDTHVFKCTVQHYRRDLEGKALTAALHSTLGTYYLEKFGPHAGWAQAVIFNAQLLGKETKKGGRKRKSS